MNATVSGEAMATKVHDQDDDQEFAEIDVILAQAKRELRRDRKLRRTMILSDIPENFALDPSCELNTQTRPVSLDTSQLDCASRDDDRVTTTTTSRALKPKLHVLGTMAPIRWMRAYMGCLRVVRKAPDFAARAAASRQQQRGRS